MRWPPAWPAIVGGGASLAQFVALKEAGWAEECQSTFVVLTHGIVGQILGCRSECCFGWLGEKCFLCSKTLLKCACFRCWKLDSFRSPRWYLLASSMGLLFLCQSPCSCDLATRLLTVAARPVTLPSHLPSPRLLGLIPRTTLL